MSDKASISSQQGRTTPPPKPRKAEQDATRKKAGALAPNYRSGLLKP